MADNSFAWAAKRGLTRTNPVHLVEEAKLVLEEYFDQEEERGTSKELVGEGAVEATGVKTYKVLIVTCAILLEMGA